MFYYCSLFYSSGRKFDKNGDIVKEWWSKPSLMEFNKKSECIEEQYSKYKVQGRYPVRGVYIPSSLEQLTNFLAVRNFHIFRPKVLEYIENRSKARYSFVPWLYKGFSYNIGGTSFTQSFKTFIYSSKPSLIVEFSGYRHIDTGIV